MSMVMDFDQSFTGPVDWSFPSPNATPNHQSFGHDIFQTPKTTTLPSHFQDAFNTPQVQSFTTPRLQHAIATPQQGSRPQHYIPQPYAQPPSTSPQAQWHPHFAPEQVLPSNVPASQVQTPPPTRDSDARKVVHQPVAFGTPSTIATRRHMTPQRQVLDTREQTLQIQFPQVTQPFANTGPMTAPVRSTYQWQPSPVQVRQASTLEDPFMSNIPREMAWSFQGGDAFEGALQEQLSQTVSQSMASSVAPGTSLHATTMSSSIDPSLVYSSPVHLLPPVPARPRSAMPGAQSEQRRRVNAKHARTDTTSSGESASRPNLRRSNTTGSARSSNVPTDIFGRVLDVPRTASPLKRVGRTPLGSISEMSKQKHRSSVILTVDENGLARTETQDDSPTRSMRARYPGLFDSDSSDPEPDESPEPISRRSSFAFNKRDERKQKAPKLDPPIEKFEGLSIPRSSSSASLRGTVTPSRAAIAATAQLRRQSSLRRTSSLRRSQSRGQGASMDTCPMNVTDDQSWIATSPEKQQFEFAPVNTRRARPPRAVMQNTLDAHNRRWSMMSVEQQGSLQGDVFAGSSQSPTKKMRCLCGTANQDERNVLYSALDSFRQYRQLAHYNVTHIRRQAFYSLPSAHTDLLCEPPFLLPNTFLQADDAIDANADIADAILNVGVPAFGLSDDTSWHGSAKGHDVDKARSTIRQLYRDWCEEGQIEREACFRPIIDALHEHIPVPPVERGAVRVLVPGAGLGRLIFDLCLAGYAVEGNEISYHQLLASNYMLNYTEAAEQHTLYPWALAFSNHHNRSDQFRSVKIPDVHPATALEAEHLKQPSGVHYSQRMSMAAGDFCVIYRELGQSETFDAVTTCFFIDTAPNVINYVETVRHCLKPGGFWINLGPLLWHFDVPSTSAERSEVREPAGQGIGDPGSFELANDEVIALLAQFGFVVEKHEDRTAKPTGYIQDPRSMLQNVYKPVFWVARKL
ncbi:hypothetical protein AMS68_002087 [Peltaster fructicola]|uniref:carnosine N-methyltransferase n=1 Tax=Peltaster fructicola TaxID=286661 RepID=A0A6H0XQ16_9PEZI|nr:hypothetical protein AMS68_002087 [Peltaster fructicola]